MSKFKVGDRVKVYQQDESRCGEVRYWNGDLVWVDFDKDTCVVGTSERSLHKFVGALFNPKQCRHLKNKKRHEIWVNEYPEGLTGTYHTTEAAADSGKSSDHIRCVRFIEARKK